MNYPRGFIGILALVIIAVLLIGGGGAYVWKDPNSVPPLGSLKNLFASEQLTPTVQSPQLSDWEIYINDSYGFSIEYQRGSQITDVDISGGRQVAFQTGDKILHISVVNKAWDRGVLKAQGNCNDFQAGVTTAKTKINEIEFILGDVSKDFSGRQSSAAIEYCTVRGETAYKIIPRIPYESADVRPDVTLDPILRRMVASFRLIPSAVSGGKILLGNRARYANLSAEEQFIINEYYSLSGGQPADYLLKYYDSTRAVFGYISAKGTNLSPLIDKDSWQNIKSDCGIQLWTEGYVETNNYLITVARDSICYYKNGEEKFNILTGSQILDSSETYLKQGGILDAYDVSFDEQTKILNVGIFKNINKEDLANPKIRTAQFKLP